MDFGKDFLIKNIGSLIRILLMPFMAYISPYLSDDQVTQGVLIIAALVVALISAVWKNRTEEKKLDVALELPKNSTKDDLMKAIKKEV
jgi:hypothetical protein